MTIGDEFKKAVEFPQYRTNRNPICLKMVIYHALLLGSIILSTTESNNTTYSSKINFML